MVPANNFNRYQKYTFIFGIGCLKQPKLEPGCGQKIETDGRAGEAEKYLSVRVLSLLILSLGPLSFLSSHSVLSLLSFSLVLARRQSAR
jgi:hypothetical protein